MIADLLTSREVIKSLLDDSITSSEDTTHVDNESPISSKWCMPILDPCDLVGRSFLLNKEDGQRIRVRIVKVLDKYEGDLRRCSSRMNCFAALKMTPLKRSSPTMSYLTTSMIVNKMT